MTRQAKQIRVEADTGEHRYHTLVDSPAYRALRINQAVQELLDQLGRDQPYQGVKFTNGERWSPIARIDPTDGDLRRSNVGEILLAFLETLEPGETVSVVAVDYLASFPVAESTRDWARGDNAAAMLGYRAWGKSKREKF